MKSKLILTVAFLLFFSAGFASAQQSAQPIKETDLVEVTQAEKMSAQGALLLDVREQDEYDAIHAPDAKLIPLGQLSSRLADIADFKDKPVVVICRSGKRSLKAVSILQENGFSHAGSVSGGMIAWEDAGLPVIKK